MAPQQVRGISQDGWFTPLQPLQPLAPAGTQPRRYETLPGQNLLWKPRSTEVISFSDLIWMGDNCDLLRIVIEALKDQICTRDWQIRLKAVPGESHKDRAKRTAKDPRVRKWTDFLNRPNPEQTWRDFLRMLLEDVFVIDAPSILLQRTYGGDIGALRVIDGQTINVVVDENGFTPQPPYTAYQQVLYGAPTINLSTKDLVYRPRNRRARKLYGYGPVEQILTTLNIAVRRSYFQLAMYTAGNVPEALYTMPGGMTEDAVKRFQGWFDEMLAGNLANRRRIWFIPGDDKGVNRLHFTKEGLIKDDADEWFARLICFAFRISPKELIKIMNRATASESQDSAEEMGVDAQCAWIEDTFNAMIMDEEGDADLEFAFNKRREVDSEKQARTDKIYIDNGTRTRNEVREDLGEGPSDNPMADELGITTALGFIPLDQIPDNSRPDVTGDKPKPSQKPTADSAKQNPPPAKQAEAKAYVNGHA
jgi:Phage portal protein